MEEWIDFMLSSEENLEAITLTTEHTINSINAQKSVVAEGMGAMKGLLDSTVGAVPVVGDITNTVVSPAAQPQASSTCSTLTVYNAWIPPAALLSHCGWRIQT